MNTFSYIVHKLHSLSDEQYHFDLTNLSMNNRAAYMKMDIDNAIKHFGTHSSSNLIQHMTLGETFLTMLVSFLDLVQQGLHQKH